MGIPEEPWRKYAGELTRLATALVGPSEAEDLVTSSYLRAVTSRQWGSVHNEQAFLVRALTNDARNHHRAASRRRVREQRAGDSPRGGHQETVVADQDALAVLSRLSVRQRAIVWMAYWLDSSSEEIAEVLGVSRRTIDRELDRVKHRLREDLT